MNADRLAGALDVSAVVLVAAFAAIARSADSERHQSDIHRLVHARAGVDIARSFLRSDVEPGLVEVFAAGAVRGVVEAVIGRPLAVDRSQVAGLAAWLEEVGSTPAEVPLVPGRTRLAPELELVRQTFARAAREVVEPVAERVHRTDEDIPQAVIERLAAMGVFGMSIDPQHGGSRSAEHGLMPMVIATEELSWASLAVGGSLLTRPEILVRALEAGGTDRQRRRLLPMIASGEALVAVAVTEPDHGSDVAGIRTTAVTDGDDWVIDGVKTWCTFAGRAELLTVLARTGPASGHRGLSLFVVEKDRFTGHGFRQEQSGGAAMEGRAIPTIGYRGMHSFEVRFDGWRVPSTALVGEADGVGRGFELQMAGFESGRLQTAARAVGLMQRAHDEAVAYAHQRSVFERPLIHQELTRAKLGSMAATIAACRHFALEVAGSNSPDDSGFSAALIKAYACRAAEWVTREAMQIHGGYGYAEEYPVSRLFVDARVLSIFEGTDEVLSLRVIGRRLLTEAAGSAVPI